MVIVATTPIATKSTALRKVLFMHTFFGVHVHFIATHVIGTRYVCECRNAGSGIESHTVFSCVRGCLQAMAFKIKGLKKRYNQPAARAMLAIRIAKAILAAKRATRPIEDFIAGTMIENFRC